jgi:hypothetical protein
MKRPLILIAVLLCVLLVAVGGVLAGSLTLGGTITSSDPTMPVVFISDPNCTGQGVTPVLYNAHVITVDTTGDYTFLLTSPGSFASLYLYVGAFDPTNGLVNCIAGSNQTPTGFTYTLDASLVYIVVPFDDTFAQAGGSYQLDITGPGNIYNGLPPGVTADVCIYPLPSGSQLVSVPAGAPAFYAADLATQVNFNLPAGTWFVSEYSGDFAKVWVNCTGSPVWIPTNAIG